MSTQFSGTITSPAADRTHTDLQPKTDLHFAAGQASGFNLGQITNEGNVTQTVTAEAVNAVNCTVEEIAFFTANSERFQAATLAPGDSIAVVVTIKADARPIGSEDEVASFEIETVWS